jgi:hypothetical protein
MNGGRMLVEVLGTQHGQVTPTYKEIAVSAKIKRKKDGDFGKKEGECV